MSSDWLAAYEAQKAAVLQKMNASKSGSSGPSSSGTSTSASVSGSSEFSGLVNIDHVKHLSKSTQVTKIMDNLKKQKNPVKSQQTSIPVQNNLNLNSNRPGWSFPSALSNQARDGHSSNTPLVNNGWNGNTLKNCPIASTASPLLGPQVSEHTNQNAATPGSSNLEGFSSFRNGTPIPKPPVQVQNSGNNKKKKGKGDESGPFSGERLQDLFKRVKCDSKRSSDDWAQEYEKRKKETIDKIVSGQVETQVGSASAYIAGPLSAVGEVSTNRHQQCPPATKPPSAFTRNAKPPPPPKALIQPQHVRKEIQHDLGSHSRFTNPEPPKFHSVSKEMGNFGQTYLSKPPPSLMNLSVAPPPTTKTGFPLKTDVSFGQNSNKYDDPFGQFSSNQNGSFGQSHTSKSRFDRNGEGSYQRGELSGSKRPHIHQQQQWNETDRGFGGKKSRFDDPHPRSTNPPKQDSRWSESGNRFGHSATNFGHQPPSAASHGFQDNRTQARSGQPRPPPSSSGGGSYRASRDTSFHGQSNNRSGHGAGNWNNRR